MSIVSTAHNVSQPRNYVTRPQSVQEVLETFHSNGFSVSSFHSICCQHLPFNFDTLLENIRIARMSWLCIFLCLIAYAQIVYKCIYRVVATVYESICVNAAK